MNITPLHDYNELPLRQLLHTMVDEVCKQIDANNRESAVAMWTLIHELLEQHVAKIRDV